MHRVCILIERISKHDLQVVKGGEAPECVYSEDETSRVPALYDHVRQVTGLSLSAHAHRF